MFSCAKNTENKEIDVVPTFKNIPLGLNLDVTSDLLKDQGYVLDSSNGKIYRFVHAHKTEPVVYASITKSVSGNPVNSFAIEYDKNDVKVYSSLTYSYGKPTCKRNGSFYWLCANNVAVSLEGSRVYIIDINLRKEDND